MVFAFIISLENGMIVVVHVDNCKDVHKNMRRPREGGYHTQTNENTLVMSPRQDLICIDTVVGDKTIQKQKEESLFHKR